jgi:hypothetical protein
MTEAVAQLQKGLDLLARLPGNSWCRQQEIEIPLALGPALIAIKGFGAPDVGEVYARARSLAEQFDRCNYLLRLLYGQWVFHIFRGEIRLALPIAEQISEIISATQGDSSWHGIHGVTRLLLGEFIAARRLFEKFSAARQRTVYASSSDCRSSMAP